MNDVTEGARLDDQDRFRTQVASFARASAAREALKRLSVEARSILSSNRQSLRQEPRQTCFSNLLLHGRQIIFYAKLLDQVILRVVNAVRCAPVSITRLADTAHVDEILFGRLNANVLDPFPPDAFVSNKHHGHMRVAKKTNIGALIGKARGRIEVVKNISPLLRRIERGVHDGEIVHMRLQRQSAQPFLVLIR